MIVGEDEIMARMDENATDDRSVYAVVNTSLTVADLKALISRLELIAYDLGYHKGFDEASRRYAPPLV